MFRQLASEFRHFPSLKVWIVTLTGTLLLLTLAFLALPEFSNLSAIPSVKEILFIALVGLFTPALFEEVVFRFLLNHRQTLASILLSTLAFVAWHPLEAHLFLHAAKPWFCDPGFLTFVGIYGAFSCFLRKWSCSLWPSLLSHWSIVITWKAVGGAQFLT